MFKKKLFTLSLAIGLIASPLVVPVISQLSLGEKIPFLRVSAAAIPNLDLTISPSGTQEIQEGQSIVLTTTMSTGGSSVNIDSTYFTIITPYNLSTGYYNDNFNIERLVTSSGTWIPAFPVACEVPLVCPFGRSNSFYTGNITDGGNIVFRITAKTGSLGKNIVFSLTQKKGSNQTTTDTVSITVANPSIPINPTISSDLSGELIKNIWKEFTVSTTNPGNISGMVRGYVDVSGVDSSNLQIEYKSAGTWYSLPTDGFFGPLTGFPITETTTEFRVKATGSVGDTVNFNIGLKKVGMNDALVSTNGSVNIITNALEDGKSQAISDLDTELAKYNSSDCPDYTSIEAIYDQAIIDINLAISQLEIDSIVSQAKTDIASAGSTCISIPDPFEQYKDNKKNELKAEYDKYLGCNQVIKNTINAIYDQALIDLDGASDQLSVDQIVNDVISKIKEISLSCIQVSSPNYDLAQKDTNTNSGSVFSLPEVPQCTDQKPNGTVDLFQIDSEGDSATLYWSPVNEANGYAIFYTRGESNWDGGDKHAVVLNYNSPGVNSFKVEDLLNLDYQFVIVPLNGCATGNLSNEMATINRGVRSVQKIVYFGLSKISSWFFGFF